MHPKYSVFPTSTSYCKLITKHLCKCLKKSLVVFNEFCRFVYWIITLLIKAIIPLLFMTTVCTSINSCFKNALPDHVVITLLLITLALDSQSTFKQTHIWIYMHFYPTQVVFSVINKMTQLHLSASIMNILINAHYFPTLFFSGEEVIKMNLQWQIWMCAALSWITLPKTLSLSL